MSPSLTLPTTTRPDEGVVVGAMTDAAAAHMALAVRMLGNVEDARETVQDAWFRAWSNHRALRDTGALHGWLRAIVARECLRTLRRRALRRWLPFTATSTEAIDPGADPERSAVATQLRGRVDAALLHLPPRQRQIWGLRFDEAWSIPEIAEATQLSVGTVKTHLERALTTLQHLLGGSHVL